MLLVETALKDGKIGFCEQCDNETELSYIVENIRQH